MIDAAQPALFNAAVTEIGTSVRASKTQQSNLAVAVSEKDELLIQQL